MSQAARETIFALSSGALPSGIAVVRVSGPAALSLLDALTQTRRPPPRRAGLRILRDGEGGILDEALVLAFPAPNSATGEDIVEFQVHGGPAVVAALLAEIGKHPGCRLAAPGEFTRRSFDAGRLDLSQVEGLADLIAAETEAQRVGALALSGGALKTAIANWQMRLVAVLAEIEAVIDFSDEADVAARSVGKGDLRLLALRHEIETALEDSGRGRLLRDGLRVVLSGAPNVGKSSLVNALTRSDVSIVSSLPGTTRDAVTVRLDLGGVVVTLIDTAGLRDATDEIEAQGVELARRQMAAADLVLALYCDGAPPEYGIPVRTKLDLTQPPSLAGLATSALTGAGIDTLLAWLSDWARATVRPGEPALLTRERHSSSCRSALAEIDRALDEGDFVLRAEGLRMAVSELDVITGQRGVDTVLDQIFSQFCIGK